MKKRMLAIAAALLACLLCLQAQAASQCSHPVDQREPTMVQYSRTVGGVRQLVHGNQCRLCKALVDYGPCTTRPGAKPTCTEPVRCVICGGIVAPATKHDFINEAANNAALDHCERCDAENPCYEGHTPAIDPAVPAACTDTGLTEGSHCAVCSAVLTAQQTTAARGHWYGEWSPCGDGTHAAQCRRSGCTHREQAPCQTLTAQMTQGEARFCPICGEVENGPRLELIQGAQVQAERPPAGEAIVRQGSGVVSVAFARKGRFSRLYAPATVILPFETSQGKEIVLDAAPDKLPVCVIR